MVLPDLTCTATAPPRPVPLGAGPDDSSTLSRDGQRGDPPPPPPGVQQLDIGDGGGEGDGGNHGSGSSAQPARKQRGSWADGCAVAKNLQYSRYAISEHQKFPRGGARKNLSLWMPTICYCESYARVETISPKKRSPDHWCCKDDKDRGYTNSYEV
uniref:Uncharacterized protein n=1 Tax=Oryza brachyantha TaxID=4533 RepID=J3L9G5_ORYBR